MAHRRSRTWLIVDVLTAASLTGGCLEDVERFVGTTEDDEQELGEPPAREGGRFNGTVSRASPNATHVFNVTERGHGNLSVGVSVAVSAGARLSVDVIGPNGPRDQISIELGPGGSGGTGTHLQDPAQGRWIVDVHLEEGSLERYRVDWCAAEPLVVTSEPGPNPGPPCSD